MKAKVVQLTFRRRRLQSKVCRQWTTFASARRGAQRVKLVSQTTSALAASRLARELSVWARLRLGCDSGAEVPSGAERTLVTQGGGVPPRTNFRARAFYLPLSAGAKTPANGWHRDRTVGVGVSRTIAAHLALALALALATQEFVFRAGLAR